MTSITVPRAGIQAGRTPNLTVEADDTAAAVAQFGDRMRQIGGRLQAEADDTASIRAQTEMTRQLGELRLELEQTNDPARIDQEWAPRAKEIRDQIVGTSSPRIQERVGLAFDDLAVKHGLALGRVAVGARKTQNAAQWYDYSRTAVEQAAAADPETRTTVLDQAFAIIARDVESGLIDELEGAKRRDAVRQSTLEAAAITGVDTDPQGFLDRVEAGEFGGLDAVSLARHQKTARSAIASEQAAAEKDAERAAKQRADEVGSQLELIADLAGKDLITAGEAEFLDSPEAQEHPGYAKAAAAVELREELPGLKSANISEIRDQLAEERRKPKTAKWQAERVEVLESLLGELEKGYANDPVAFAQSQGIRVPELPAFDPQNPQAFTEGLRSRLSFGRALEAEGRSDRPVALTNAEVEQLKPLIGSSADPTQRVEFAEAMLRAGGGQIPTALAAELEADPVFLHGMGLIGATNDKGLAAQLFRGQQKIDQKTVNMPPPKDVTALFDEITHYKFEDQPKVKAALIRAASALFADGASEVDLEEIAGGVFRDGDAREPFESAVQRVLGARADRNGDMTIGGLQELSTGWTVLPPGVSRRAADEAIEKVDAHLRGGVWRPSPYDDASGSYFNVFDGQEQPEQLDPLRALTAASLSGAAPDLGDAPQERWENVELVAVGGDAYKLVYAAPNGRTYDLTDTNGAEFRFSLRKLIEAPK